LILDGSLIFCTSPFLIEFGNNCS